MLTSLAEQWKVDLSVVGFHGRKGPKADPTVMGSAVQWMSVNSYGPCMIVKNQVLRKDRPEGYVLSLCCDGSNKAMKALDLMCAMKSDNDKIHVMICEQTNLMTELIKSNVASFLEEKNCLTNSHIHVIVNTGKNPKDLIREHMDDEADFESDFVFVGNTGADFTQGKEKYLGSVANELICHTKYNIVFVC